MSRVISIVSRAKHSLLAFSLACALVTTTSCATADKRREREPQISHQSSHLLGYQVFSIGHSFLAFQPPLLEQLAHSTGLTEHRQLGASILGGSLAQHHWDLPDSANTAKQMLRSGSVQALQIASLNPIFNPDPGVQAFAKLAWSHNPRTKIFLQANWMAWDTPQFPPKRVPKTLEELGRNGRTGSELLDLHREYFDTVRLQVDELNAQAGRHLAFVVPAGSALIAVREEVRKGKLPGVPTQDDLFTDLLGHPGPVIQAVVAYCHFAMMYNRSPVGLPLPADLKDSAPDLPWPALNPRLQQIAWDAVAPLPRPTADDGQ